MRFCLCWGLIRLKDFLKSTAFKIIFAVFSVILAVFVYTHFYPNDNFIDNAVSGVVAPVQKAVSFVHEKASDYSYLFEDKSKIKAENESLKEEISSLRDKMVDYYDTKRENARLLKYYDIKKADESLKFLSASVVGRNLESGFGNFTIDQGSDDGVTAGDAVITENGFVGTVYKVSKHMSFVKTILSSECKTGAVDAETGETGVISGNADLAASGNTRMIFISSESKIQEGSIITTAGMSGTCPKNLKIGRVKSALYDKYDAFYYVTIEPFENIKEIKNVFVITDFKNKGVINTSDYENLKNN